MPIEVKGSITTSSDDTLELECIASGNPIPTITWQFNGVEFKAGQNLDGTPNDAPRHTMTSMECLFIFIAI